MARTNRLKPTSSYGSRHLLHPGVKGFPTKGGLVIVSVKRSSAALVAAVSLAGVGAVSATAANNSNQTGLVNVSLGDVNVLNNTNLAVAANVAATVCAVNVPVAVLSVQLIASGGMTTVCTTNSGPLNVTQSV